VGHFFPLTRSASASGRTVEEVHCLGRCVSRAYEGSHLLTEVGCRGSELELRGPAGEYQPPVPEGRNGRLDLQIAAEQSRDQVAAARE